MSTKMKVLLALGLVFLFAGSSMAQPLFSVKNLSNTEMFRVHDNGYVGIGLTAPTQPLEIATTTNQGIGLFNSADNKRWVLAYDETDNYFYIDEYGSERRLVIANGGNVGIGTTNPISLLNVAGGTIRSDLGATGISFIAAGIGSNLQIKHDGTAAVTLFNSGAGGFKFNDVLGTTNLVTFLNNGNVGIGTNAPSQKLHLFADATSQVVYSLFETTDGTETVTGYVGSDIRGTSPHAGIFNGFKILNIAGSFPLVLSNSANQPIIFGTNDMERMRIHANGNVGIGTATPTAGLHVGGGNAILVGPNTEWSESIQFGMETTPASVPTATVGTTDGNIHIEPADGHHTYINFYQDDGNVLMNASPGHTGNVGIGVGNPEGKLSVAGHINIPGNYCLYGPGGIGDAFNYNNGIYNGPVQHYSLGWYSTASAAEAVLTGAAGIKLLVGGPGLGGYVTTAGVFSYSDARLKTNVAPMSHMLDTVMQMRGVTFNLKANDQPSFGFIAQELEEVFPLAVDTGSDGYKGINYANLTAVLVEAIKEQQAQIDALKAEIEALKK